jgi:diguanylate cyclase (GGDEF)-like protein
MTLHTRLYELHTFGTPFGAIFLDIDHFKQFNDTYSHKTGDDVLVMIARVITSILRHQDTLVRWGGDEFVLILPDITTQDVLTKVAERIRIFIERSFIMAGSTKLEVTASIGATLAMPDDTPESNSHRADTLMYASKTLGGDGVTTDQ